MIDHNRAGFKSELFERVASLSNGNCGVSYQDFARVADNFRTKDISIAEYDKINDFASDQLGHWEAEWFFSWAHSPNTNALTEMQSWKVICQSCLDELKEKLPSVFAQIEHKHRLIVLRHSLKRAADYNELTLFRKCRALLLSKTAIALNKMGLCEMGSHLYALALYPKGTVGRLM